MSAKITIPLPEWLDRFCTWPVLVYRKHKKKWPYRRIYIGQGKWAIVEPQDYYWLKEYNWYPDGNGKEFYAYTNVITGPGKTRMTSMHRLIMEPPAHLLVDHRNNNTLDNRRSNLRIATKSENNQNAPKRKNTSSRFIGVSFNKQHQKWVAAIHYKYKKIFLGLFDNEIDAALAYDRAARKYYGQFAKLNFPKEIERSPELCRRARLNFPQKDCPNQHIENEPLKTNEKTCILTKKTQIRSILCINGAGFTMKIKVLLIFVMLIAGFSSSCGPDRSKNAPKQVFTDDWESLKQRTPAPDWFRDAKFGIYFHWGVYSVPAFANEWYPRNMYDRKSVEFRHHVKTYGEPNVFGYPDFVPMFKAQNFDANQWADLFKKAGARFAGPVAEHHDGFSMWASKVNPWNAKDMGPHRDLVGELEKAIRKRGMKFVTTFHHERNGLYVIEKGGNRRWTGHYEFVKRCFPELLDDPNRAIMYGYMPARQFFETWEDKLDEVIDNYHPDLMYFDSWLDEIPPKYKKQYLAHYFNDAVKLGREVVVTYKQQDLPREVGIEDFEKGRAEKLTDFAWLTDDTISTGSWCYTQSLGIKKPEEIIRTLADIVSKNGQLMLNISPMADGTIPENQRKVLLEIGDWMKRNGEAIYETRPFVDYGEGPTKIKGGQFAKMKGSYGPKDIRYTRKGKVVYALVLGWPGENTEVLMTIFGREGKAGNIGVKNVSMLGTWKKIKWMRGEEGLIVTTPAKKADDMAIVFKITTN